MHTELQENKPLKETEGWNIPELITAVKCVFLSLREAGSGQNEIHIVCTGKSQREKHGNSNALSNEHKDGRINGAQKARQT